MTDDPVLDTNDQALIGYFVRGMVRFQKFARAQGAIDEKVRERIGVAYAQALTRFTERQKGEKHDRRR
jgi:hypothetical protein